jgi:hypothetical protein
MALLSVALLFVAPVISKTLAHQTTCQQPASAMMMMKHHDMDGSGHCDQHLTMGNRMMSGHAMSPMEEIACGYCQLLIHMPFVLVMLTVLLLLMLRCIRKAPSLRVTFSPIFRVWPPQRARAPPAVFLSYMS